MDQNIQRINAAEDLKWARYQACVALHHSNIPYVVWFEDALRYYQVPTCTFELYLLVDDLTRATEALSSSGWALDTTSPARIAHFAVSTAQHRLSRPKAQSQIQTGISTSQPNALLEPPARDHVVLLLANDWYFDLSTDVATIIDSSVHIPHLPVLLDCLIEALLEELLKESDVSIYIIVQIGYLYEYNKEVEKNNFALQLRYEHRQFHFDIISGLPVLTRPGIQHERLVRDALQKGSRTLCDSSTTKKDLMRGLPPEPRLPQVVVPSLPEQLEG